jgi:tetratricopeptide (TPR) repeat protein
MDGAYDEALELLKRAFVAGNDGAHQVLRRAMAGQFGGLGIAFEIDQDAIKVVAVHDGAAGKSGVLVGDLITHFDGHGVSGLDAKQVGLRMRGPVGTAITATLIRKGQAQPLDIRMVRDVVRGSDRFSAHDRERAACALGDALMRRFPGGERETEAVEAFQYCKSGWNLARIFMKRMEEGRASETDQIFLLRRLPSELNLPEKDRILEKVVAGLSGHDVSADGRRAVSAYLYAAQGGNEFSTLAQWERLSAQLDRALDLDPDADRSARHADALYNAVLRSRFSGELRLAHLSALERIAAAYASRPEFLTNEQLARLAALHWHGLSSSGSPEITRSLFKTLADRGDSAARHTLALEQVMPALFETSKADFLAYLALLPAVRSSDSAAARGGVCDRADASEAISVQTSLYVRLTTMRAVPDLRQEIMGRGQDGHALRAMIKPGTAVALFARDDLRQCLWLFEDGARPTFAAVYLPADFVRHRLQEFYQGEVDDEEEQRRPVARQPAAPESRKPATSVRPDGAAALRGLSAALFPETVAGRLHRVHALTVVPFGDIGTVPFAALPIPQTNEALLDRMSTSIAPNFVDLYASSFKTDPRILEGFRRRIPGCDESGLARAEELVDSGATGRGRIRAALIVGDPHYQDRDYKLEQLEGARAEARDVGKLLGVRPLIGKAATRAAVMKAAPMADRLYFASHGLAVGRSGLEGFLALADGARLTARDVQKMCLRQSRLAVLSACETGLGQSVGGGVIKLARAFQIAGVSDVIMSLWSVYDDATRALMVRFLAEYQAGVAAPMALRTAMIATRKEYPAHKYWAGFTVFSATLHAGDRAQ